MKSLLILALSLPFLAASAVSPSPLHAQQSATIHEEGDTLPLTPSRHIKFDEHQGTWVSLDVSPDGKTVIFELLGDIYQMAVSGGEAHCIICGLPFDSQPTFSPDGTAIAFVSDRSGEENLWIARPDGSHPRQISALTDNSVFISPAWSADGKSIYISRFNPDINAFQLFRYTVADSHVDQLTFAKPTPSTPKEFRNSALGAAPSPDGHYLYYAAKTGLGFDDDNTFPLWHIVRRNLATGEENSVVHAQGSAFRPQVSPDGKSLVYATRFQGRTGLRIRSLVTDEDHWLLYPIQRDDQETSASRDLLPRYTFTPDSQSILINFGGLIHRFDITTHTLTTLPFVAHVNLPMGPYLRQDIREDLGPVRARIIQTPSQSPDGTQLVFSALTHIYVMSFAENKPRRLTQSSQPEFDPSWSPDGRSIVYVTWTAIDGGNIWCANADGSGEPTRLTDHPDLYRNPVFSPDGKSILALRSSNYEYNHTYMEFSPFQSDAIELPSAGGPATVLASGILGNIPQFTSKPGSVYLNFADGLYKIPLNGAPKHRALRVTGPTWYFVDGTADADAIKISPDGQWALAQITEQLYLLHLPHGTTPSGKEFSIELGKLSPLETRITSIGADFFNWADSGKTITWAIGSTYFQQSLASVLSSHLNPLVTAEDQRPNVHLTSISVEVPRDTPHGQLVLRGATAITMRGAEVIPNADILILDNHIAAIGPTGTLTIPPGATIRDVTGKYILPGFTDVHLHWADVRRGELTRLDPGFLSSLAFGITSALDPSPLSIDMLAYQDLLDAGMMTGSRVFSTGPAVFSFNQLQSEQQAYNLVRRYSDFYRIQNLKEYRTGNRMQREWLLEATQSLHMQATTEGALDMKLDMTQIQDGFPGNEHAFSAVPIADDIVQLFARSGVSYTPTLQISNGGLAAQEFYYTTQPSPDAINTDRRLRHFMPGFFIDAKTERLRWALPREYAFPLVAAGAASIQRAGGLVAVGSHGEIPGLGYHLELQALATGGMTPMEILHAATLGSSKTIGRDSQFGSLEAGKFADLIILDKNPLSDIKDTLSIHYVMKNGRLYDSYTLNEIWPQPRTLPPLWFQNDTAGISPSSQP
ncbi:MAG: amidohydrolase family protein [Acidobacteria bacterium]|nr:amidohydrolase family protein [Acidobacteriota bacterium]